MMEDHLEGNPVQLPSAPKAEVRPKASAPVPKPPTPPEEEFNDDGERGHEKVINPISMSGAIAKAVGRISSEAMSKPERGGGWRNPFAWLAGATTGRLAFDAATLVGQHLAPPFVGAVAGAAFTPAIHLASRILGKETYGRLTVHMLKNQGKFLRGSEAKDAMKEVMRTSNTMKDMLSMVDPDGNIDMEAVESMTYGQDVMEKMVVEATAKAGLLSLASKSGYKFNELEAQQLNRIGATAKIAEWILEKKFAEDPEIRLDFMQNRFYQGLAKQEKEGYTRLVARSSWRNAKRAFVVGAVFDALQSDFVTKTLFGKVQQGVNAIVTGAPGWFASSRAFVEQKFAEAIPAVTNWVNAKLAFLVPKVSPGIPIVDIAKVM